MGHKRKRNEGGRAEEPRSAAPPAEYQFVRSGDVLLRLVKPYPFSFQTHAKARWIGRELQEVCVTEFGARTPEYYREAIVDGRIRVNGEVVPASYVLCNGDAIKHDTVRHEPPIFAGMPPNGQSGDGKEEPAAGDPIEIVGTTADLVAVDKPPTMPVHPSGAYHHNTLLHVLAAEHPEWRKGDSCSLHLVHRLDRLTSGLVLLARSPAVAQRMCEEMKSGKFRKEYLARVRGDFPSIHQEDQMPPSWREANLTKASAEADLHNDVDAGNGNDCTADKIEGGGGAASSAGGAGSLDVPRPGGGPSSGLSYASLAWSPNGAIRLSCPLRCVSHRDGVHECHPDGKHAATVIARCGYDAATNTSLVRCTPVTGRTHQIRIHLQQLGFPIANDPCYGGDIRVTSAECGKQGAGGDQIADERVRGEVGNSEHVGEQSQQPGGDNSNGPRQLVGSPAPTFTETQLRCGGIWLHALRYSGPGFSFATSLPSWAKCFEEARALESACVHAPQGNEMVDGGTESG